jgi:hypothetical protein
MTPRLVFSLALATGLVACGGDDREQRAQPGAVALSADVVYRAASDGEHVFVLAVHPDTGEVAPYGPALPLGGNVKTYVLQVSSLSDGRQVVSASNSPESFVLVGDGTIWKIVAHDSCGLSALTSPGQSMIRIHHNCQTEGSLRESEELVGPDGTSRWRGTTPEQVLGMAPDDSYAVIGECPGLSLWTAATGSTRALPGTDVDATLQTSLVVHDDSEALWLDNEGHPLRVPGFAGDAAALAPASPERFLVVNGITPFGPSAVQFAAGQLSALADRAVTPLQPLPATVQPVDVAAVLPGHWTVVQPDGGTSLSLVGPDGVVTPLYGDPTAPAPSFPPLTELEIVTESLVAPRPWLLVEKDVLPASGSSSDTWASTLTLVFPGDPASGVAPELQELQTGSGLFARTTFPSADGRYLFYLDHGRLHAVDVRTRTDVATPAPYRFQ